MIDIIEEKEANLKNIKQIGTPKEEDRVYLSDKAYRKMYEEREEKKSVFVLMGHTENSVNRYATFVETAIPVESIAFEKNIPVWNNQVWSRVFEKIKESFEELIIVGWALNLKGFSPKITPEIEKLHREQFGGVHQLLFLMNSAEQEEYFYINKNNHLSRKAGFFVYYQMKEKKLEIKTEEPRVEIEIPDELKKRERRKVLPEGKYRASLRQKENTYYGYETGTPGETTFVYGKGFSVIVVAAVAALVIAIGANSVHGTDSDWGVRNAIETVGRSVGHMQRADEDEKIEREDVANTETGDNSDSTEKLIPVEEY